LAATAYACTKADALVDKSIKSSENTVAVVLPKLPAPTPTIDAVCPPLNFTDDPIMCKGNNTPQHKSKLSFNLESVIPCWDGVTPYTVLLYGNNTGMAPLATPYPMPNPPNILLYTTTTVSNNNFITLPANTYYPHYWVRVFMTFGSNSRDTYWKKVIVFGYGMC
jgi:hypothetical protein